jgi:low affinity Fe/Cu permease
VRIKEDQAMKNMFRKFAGTVATASGSPGAFLLAFLVIVVWAITGPIFNFSDTWQLVINTGTTIVTFLMVFLIQNTQNRDAVAIQLKLDELLRAVQGARTSMVDLEELDDKEILRLKKEFERIHQHASVGEQIVEEGLEDSTATRNGVGGN